MYAHDAELERQWASLDGITADALEESRINWELAGVICARMDASRRSTEKLLGVLQVGRTCMPPGLGLVTSRTCSRLSSAWNLSAV